MRVYIQHGEKFYRAEVAANFFIDAATTSPDSAEAVSR